VARARWSALGSAHPPWSPRLRPGKFQDFVDGMTVTRRSTRSRPVEHGGARYQAAGGKEVRATIKLLSNRQEVPSPTPRSGVYTLPPGALVSLEDAHAVLGDVIAAHPAGVFQDPRHTGACRAADLFEAASPRTRRFWRRNPAVASARRPRQAATDHHSHDARSTRS